MFDRSEQEKLWTDLRDRKPGAVEAIVRAYEPLAKSIALKHEIPPHVDRDDIIQCAMLGLFQAASRFDVGASDGNFVPQFTAFARQRIKGAILDYQKSKSVSWAPRELSRRIKAHRLAEEALAQELGRPPLKSELAERLGVDVSDLVRMQVQLPVAMAVSSNEDGGGVDGRFDFGSDEDVEGLAGMGGVLERVSSALEGLPAALSEALWEFAVVQEGNRVRLSRKAPEAAVVLDEAVSEFRRALRSESIS